MYKMVIQSVLLTAAALVFIFYKSDNIRAASQSGDITALTNVSSVSSKYSDIDMSGPDPVYKQPFYKKYDPRKLWRERPKTIKLNTKTVKAPAASELIDQTALIAAKGIDPSTVTVVKLK